MSGATPGREELLEAMRRFAADHGLTSNAGIGTLARKFLVVTANGVDLNVAYPLIGRDLPSIQYRVGDKVRFYRSTANNGYVYDPPVWSYLFSNANADAVMEKGEGNRDLDGYRHFRRQMEKERSVKFADLPEWKKALAFYMSSQVYRNGHTICKELIGVPHNLIQGKTQAMNAKSYAKAIAAVVNGLDFQFLDQPDYRMVLRDPEFVPSVNRSENSSKSNPWDSSSASIGDMVASIEAKPMKKWDLAAKKAYRANPLINEIAKENGDFCPLNTAFQTLVGDAFQQTDSKAEDDAHWADALTIVDYSPVDPIMNSSEMQQFLYNTAEEVSAKDFQSWTAQDAVKKLIVAHTPNWRRKWQANWVLDESVIRAVNQHLQRYPQPSPQFKAAVDAMDPRKSE